MLILDKKKNRWKLSQYLAMKIDFPISRCNKASRMYLYYLYD